MCNRISQLIAVCIAFSVLGCSNAVSTPDKIANTDIEDAELSLKASAMRLSDTGNFFLRYLVSIDRLHDEPAQGSIRVSRENLEKSTILNLKNGLAFLMNGYCEAVSTRTHGDFGGSCFCSVLNDLICRHFGYASGGPTLHQFHRR